MSASFALPLSRLEVVSLRNAKHGIYANSLPGDNASPGQLAKLAVASITLVRIPMIIAGIVALVLHWWLVACTFFITFAVTDYFDGVAARAVGQDTALRRIGDALIDRVSIHVTLLVTCAMFDAGWLPWSLLLLRDLAQGAYSAYNIKNHHIVVVGAHWHMSYGIGVLVWECMFVATGAVSPFLSVVVLVVALAICVDYVVRCVNITRA